MAKARNLHRLPFAEEAIGNAALIQHLDGSGMQAAGARALELPVAPTLDNRNIHARQGQFACQHQARRTSAGDQHRMIG